MTKKIKKLKSTYKPEISIICSVYNREKYIEKCVDSILKQTFKNIELILIDNGSTDNSSGIIDEYAKKDKRVVAVHNPQGSTYGTALNQGIDMAGGKYIGIVESDDWISETMYEKLYHKIVEFDAECCIGGFFRYTDKNGIVNNEKPYDEVSHYTYDNRLFSLKDSAFLLNCHESMWAKLYKKSFIEEIKFDETAKYIDAVFMTEVLCKSKKLIGCHEKLYYYRVDNPDASSLDKKQNQNLIKILKDWGKAKEVLKKYNVYDEYKELLYARASRPGYRFYQMVTDEYKLEFFKQWQLFTEDIKNDPSFTFKYFIPEIKTFVKNVLNGNYKYVCCSDYKKIGTGKIKLFEQIQYPDLSIKKILGITVCQKNQTNRVTTISYFADIIKVKKDYNKDKISVYLLGIRVFNYVDTAERLAQLVNQVIKTEVNSQAVNKMLNQIRQIVKTEVHAQIHHDVVKLVGVKLNRALTIQNQHAKVFPQFKGINRGKKVVIIAAGPTLNDYKPIKKAVNIGVNKTFQQNIVPLDYLFILDYPNMKSVLPLANNYRTESCKKFYGMLQEENHAYFIPDTACPDNVYRYYINNSWNDLSEIFNYDLSTLPLPCFFSVTFQAIAFALWTQPSELYLVGCDNDFSKHFDNSPLLSQDSQWIKLHRIRTTDGYNKLKKFASVYYPDTKIISVNPVGLKGMFEDVYTEKYLEKHKELKTKGVNIL